MIPKVNTSKAASSVILTRKYEKEKLRNEHTATLNNFFLFLIKKLHYEKENIDYTSYIYFLILLQLRLHYISKMFNLTITIGATAFLITHTVFTIFVGLPTFMLLMSMVRYSRRGYIRFWHCVPILQGLAYTFILWESACEIMNVTLSALSLLYTQYTIANRIPWTFCDFEDATKLCINVTIKSFPKKFNNGTASCLIFPALEYFRVVVQKRVSRSLKLGSINGNLAMAVSILWSILLFFTVCGFRSFQNKIKKLQAFVFFVWLFVFLITVNNLSHYQTSLKQFHNAWNMKNMLDVLVFVLNQNTVTTMAWIATLYPSFSLPITDAIIVYSFKLITLSALIVWVPVLLKIIVYNYKTIDLTCLALTGFDIIFAVIPDIISRYPFPRTTSTLWFFGILLHGFLSPLYTLTATIDSLGDAFPSLYQYRGHVCVFICTICWLFNLLYVTRMGLVLMHTWMEYGNVILSEISISVTILALTFIYSIPKLVDDYHFAFGKPPFKLWIELWKIIPFITLFHMVLTVYKYTVSIKITKDNPAFVKWTTTVAFLMMLPIFVVILLKYLKLLKQHMVSFMIKPDADWGYYIESKRKERELFNPQTELRYKTSQLKCSHNCLVNSKNLKKLQELNECYVKRVFEENFDTEH
ncbi:hypothetical protein RN001_009317 [Aquatica leii]|uniref:Uncharacterized protein n=1 Tax=Aquatica leii TaxID=1421715 RepID=A0AAN7S840_9COLE|nr:hypothetical protein RN001_009317 [Aquatica leii]